MLVLPFRSQFSCLYVVYASDWFPLFFLSRLVSVVDESTDTAEEAKIPEIKFKSSLSYAEKLLLKKHWRMKSAETSSDTDSQCQSRSMVTPLSDTGSRCASRLHSPGSFSRSHTALDSSTDTGDEGNSFMGKINRLNKWEYISWCYGWA